MTVVQEAVHRLRLLVVVLQKNLCIPGDHNNNNFIYACPYFFLFRELMAKLFMDLRYKICPQAEYRVIRRRRRLKVVKCKRAGIFLK